MDRSNGGDKNDLAPPRPPKSMFLFHRPRARDPESVNSCPFANVSPVLSHTINQMKTNLNESKSLSASSTIDFDNSHQRTITPSTAPLTPLQTIRITSFKNNMPSTYNTSSRHRAEIPQQIIRPLLSDQVASTPITLANSNSNGNSINPAAEITVSNSVTLHMPRPANERFPNEYVDTSFSKNKISECTLPGSYSSTTSTIPNNRFRLNSHVTEISTIDGNLVLNSVNHEGKMIFPNRTTIQVPNLLPITSQPSLKVKFCKEDPKQNQNSNRCHRPQISTSDTLNISSIRDEINSIRCPHCNRCRCEECKRPRQLPSKWFCDNNCFCSAETIIDYGSCLCCVKALFYHCSKDQDLDCDNETIGCAEDPCSCVSYKRTSRWGCLGALSMFLPCLCCYWPMRGCVSLCAKCYANRNRPGCQCKISAFPNNVNNSFTSRQIIANSDYPSNQDPYRSQHLRDRQTNNNDPTPEKRLLDSFEN